MSEPLLTRGHVEEGRRAKRAELEALGVAPFAYAFDRSHSAAEALAAWDDALADDGPVVRVAGRLVAMRGQGKTLFAHLEDASGRIQLYCRRDALGDAWAMLELLDLDDHVGVVGRLFRTRTGEVTIAVAGCHAPRQEPPPVAARARSRRCRTGTVVTHGGLTDPEVRYRQRYADFAVHPELRETFRLRARVIAHIRRFLDERGFLEVETPVLQPLYGGASARPFVTHHNALDMPLYLRIADELYLKRLIVGGFERVYEIAHDFRNEGMDRTHNPEFTMLEWYMAYADYHDVLAMFEELLVGLVQATLGGLQPERQGTTLDFTPPYPRVSFVEGIRQVAGVDVLADSEESLRQFLLRKRGIGRGRGHDERRPAARRDLQGDP